MDQLTPVQIDTELARLWRIEAEAEARRDHYLRPRRDGQPTSEANKRAAAEQETLRAQAAAEAAPYQAEFSRRGGWNRYFLVTNTGGHVHRERRCTTCWDTTQYSWLVELADCDESAMVDEWGERACTVCFPNAPTHPRFAEPSRRDLVAREAKAEGKATKAAAKAEKAITDVDGRPLRVGHDTYGTKVAARNALSAAFQDVCWYGERSRGEYAENARKLAPALTAAGVDWVPVAERAIAKVAKENAAPNPYASRLSEQQIAEHADEMAKNLAAARTLLADLKGA